MAEIEGAIRRQSQSLSIVFLCAVDTKLASLFYLEFPLQIYIKFRGYRPRLTISTKTSPMIVLSTSQFSKRNFNFETISLLSPARDYRKNRQSLQTLNFRFFPPDFRFLNLFFFRFLGFQHRFLQHYKIN